VYSSLPLSLRPPAVTTIKSDATHVVLVHANVIIAIWFGPQEADACLRLYDMSVNLAKRTGAGKVSALSIAKASTAAPSPETREALGRLHEDPKHVIHRSALVFGKGGFVASIVRSIVLGLTQRSSRRGGHRVFDNTDEALQWVLIGLPPAKGQSISLESLLLEIDRHSSQQVNEAPPAS
jgi:hypothetical protein